MSTILPCIDPMITKTGNAVWSEPGAPCPPRHRAIERQYAPALPIPWVDLQRTCYENRRDSSLQPKTSARSRRPLTYRLNVVLILV